MRVTVSAHTPLPNYHIAGGRGEGSNPASLPKGVVSALRQAEKCIAITPLSYPLRIAATSYLAGACRASGILDSGASVGSGIFADTPAKSYLGDTRVATPVIFYVRYSCHVHGRTGTGAYIDSKSGWGAQRSVSGTSEIELKRPKRGCFLVPGFSARWVLSMCDIFVYYMQKNISSTLQNHIDISYPQFYRIR